MATPAPAAVSEPEAVLFEGHPAVVRGIGALLVAVVTLGLALVVLWLRARSVRYRLTTQRVVVEQGLLSKRMDQIDLYRINDYVVERPFGQRLLGTGNLVLEAMDRSTSTLRIEGIRTDVVALYEKLRQATESEKRARGVRLVDYE